MNATQLPKPMVLFDGECGFCSASMRHWMMAGAGSLDFFPSQSGMGDPYGLPPDKPMGSLHLVEEDGSVRKGAEAVFRMMSLCGSLLGRLAWYLYQHVPPFRITSEWGYRRVAERRASISRMMCRLPQESGK